MKTQLILFPLILTILISPAFSYNSTLTSKIQNLYPNTDPLLCDGNHFKHISTYSLGKQNDLTLTFGKMEKQTHVDKVVYKDQLFRTYTIFPLKLSFSYADAKQTATPVGIDQIKISGGTLRISYTFNWQKKQLSSSIEGTGKGVVSTDAISFIKSLDINAQTKHLQWNFVSAEPIKITNSLTVSQFKPYKQNDYDVVNQMFNVLKSGQPTVKTKLIQAINANFTNILSKIVHENNDTWRQEPYVEYRYSDYRGSFSIGYDNYIQSVALSSGLDLTLSKVTQNDSKFECGQKVPVQARDIKKYGGIQQFISNSFIKSTLRYAIDKNFLDVLLTQEFWQSPAFQFFMGDVHQVIPSTKNISTMEPITGKCKALDDSYFNVKAKTGTSYQVSTNFTCYLNIFDNTKRLVGIDIAVDYEILVILLPNNLDFKIKSITGVPTFYEEEQYPIKNMDLAKFMIEQTLNMAKNQKVIGSGFKTLNRKAPGVEVNEKYLFLYDTSAKSTIETKPPQSNLIQQI